MSEDFSPQNANDLLINFSDTFTDDEKKLLWKLIRYLSLTLYIKLDYNIEIHHPRSSVEKFTYESDKLWSKIIYYLIYLNTSDIKSIKSIQSIYKYIVIGGYVNLKKYWYNILPKKENYANELLYYSDTTYYKLKTYKPFSDSTIDGCIINVLYYIINNVYNKDEYLSKVMLEYIINKNDITKKLQTKFINYLNTPYISPCQESENKMDMYNLLYDYIIRR
jgi:hypothetical protein